MKIIALIAFLSLLRLPLFAASPYEEPGKSEVEVIRLTLHDAARDRDVPLKAYLPKADQDQGSAKPAAVPVIIFSHGLGGSCEGYEYLGRFWASHGYASIHLQHLGSDSALLKEPQPMAALREAIAEPKNSINRPLDLGE
jgi:predicted dienelactone hydrolase